MARAKKASRRRYRRFNYSRWYRRRKYRRRYPKRSGRRFPKDTEVKSVSKIFGLQTGTVPAENEKIQFVPGYSTVIGTSAAATGCIAIPIGTGQGERVGAKVEPIKLRISGAISLVSKAQNQDSFAPNFWQVRCIVYQVKGGNSSYSPLNYYYHQLAMATSDGNLTAGQLQKLLSTYYCEDVGGKKFNFNEWIGNNGLAKQPLRRGLGTLFRVLYKKSFWINTQKNPIKQFRFITRKPRRLVYPEKVAALENSDPAASASNCIYIVWLFQPGSFNTDMVPVLNLNYHVDLFYTDK